MSPVSPGKLMPARIFSSSRSDHMFNRKTTLALAVAMALGLPVAASAQGLNFNYLEANYVNVDVDISESFTDEDGTFSLSTDSDYGFHVGGAWEVWENLHLFGEYSKASQDLELTGTIDGVTGSFKDDFDVIRYRFGLGYAYPVSGEMSLYGRVSYDYLEFDFDVDSVDDDGFGAEVGLLWAAMPQFHVQPYVRYTSVGEVDTSEDSSDSFDSDVLVGVGARYFFTENFALQGAYEYGEIRTWSVGVRFAF
jgi:opacity protein-like surface antigen